MSTSVDKNLIGRCGLYCGTCEIYRAGQDSADLRSALAKKHRCRPEEIRCDGCQTLGASAGWAYEKRWGINCKIFKCLNDKNIRFCFQCPHYDSCAQHAALARMCSGLDMDIRENLSRIQAGEAEDWLAEQERKYLCPRCRRPVIVSNSFPCCHWCGQRLPYGKDP
jgi:hypothetical protein